MEGCAVPASVDMEEMMVQSYISRMLSDNYTLLIVFLVVTILLGVVLIYFVKQFRSTYTDYKKHLERSDQQQETDNEVELTDEERKLVDPVKYQAPEKTKFYDTVGDVYKEYNTEKTNYIKSLYGTENDDYIDEKMAYKSHDNYDYKKKE